MQYPDKTLFDAVLTLDRCARGEELDSSDKDVQKVLLATVLLSLKLTYSTFTLPVTSFSSHIAHLAKGQVGFEDVLTHEMQLVTNLRGILGVPTALDLLEALGESLETSSLCRSFAKYLMQLSLSDVSLHYGSSHALLAAAVWLTAMWATGAPPEAATIVLQEVAACTPDLSCLCFDVHHCCHGLIELLVELQVQFPVGSTVLAAYASILNTKFAPAWQEAYPETILAPSWPRLWKFLEKVFKAHAGQAGARR